MAGLAERSFARRASQDYQRDTIHSSSAGCGSAVWKGNYLRRSLLATIQAEDGCRLRELPGPVAFRGIARSAFFAINIGEA